ncbi:MAG: hypothetical protein ACX93T_04175, partial [Bacteroidota bacterium]
LAIKSMADAWYQDYTLWAKAHQEKVAAIQPELAAALGSDVASPSSGTPAGNTHKIKESIETVQEQPDTSIPLHSYINTDATQAINLWSLPTIKDGKIEVGLGAMGISALVVAGSYVWKRNKGKFNT